MSKEKLTKARELMEDGQYGKARAALKGVKDPAAGKLLAKLDELEDKKPSGSSGGGGRDLLHVLLLTLVFTALFGGIGFAVASSMGIKVAAPKATATPSGAVVSANTAIPPTATPTEIPCEAQTWWDAHRADLTKIIGGALDLTIEMRPADIQKLAETFKTWRTTFEAETVAPCLATLQQGLVATNPNLEAYITSFTTVTTQRDRMILVLPIMDSLKPVTEAVTALNITIAPDDEWVGLVQQFTLAECPVDRWLIDTFFVRDYARFFTLVSQDATDMPLAEVQNMLRTARDLKSAFETDSLAFPECVKPISDHFNKGMGAYIDAINSVLNQDMTSVQNYLVTLQTEFNAFATAIEASGSLIGDELEQTQAGQ
ncbi:MAG TPA: hypothetical protein VHO69_04210 [Phototrophicaceae bacterium]|nr:hypothetical protein [Phototrophicaceae bacterium]